MRVAMLEDGARFTADDFTARPREMTATLYRDAGQIDDGRQHADPAAARPQRGRHDARELGHLLPHPGAGAGAVARALRARGAHRARVDPLFRRVERILNVAQVPPELAGRNAAVVKRGADALGWSGDYIYRNVKGCVGSGVCAFGCPTNAKQHTGLTYVPRAWDAGATTWSEVRARRDRDRGRPRPRRGGEHARRRRAAGGVRPRGRGLRRDPHAAAAAPQRARRRVRAARREPRHPPGHRRARPVRRGDRHARGRAAVVLHRRVRRRGDHVRGRGRPARLPGDELAVLARAPSRADAALPQPRRSSG